MARYLHLHSILLIGLLLAAPPTADAQQISGLQAAAAIEKTLIDVIARSEKSVVAIARVRKQRTDKTFDSEFRPDPFGRPAIARADPQPTDPDFVPNEYGTGVVIGRRGLILTAYHVLGDDSEHYVRTQDRKIYRARIKAADPRSDLAVLEVDAIDLTPITFGDASKLRKGQIVITLGNPYAIARDGQVSAGWGIVANLSRKAPPTPDGTDSTGKRTLHHFGTLIQTDAKLNLGTSGGPLLNLQGEMIGLTVALAATAGYETSAGYAIPIDETFRRVIDTLRDGREVEYGLLGIQPANLTAAELLAGLRGIRVDRVVRGTPADRFGLRLDDIVTAVDGTPIYEADALVLEVGKLPVEAVARLSVIRDGRSRRISVTLAKYPVRGKKIVTNRPQPWRGMQVDYATALVDVQPRGQSMPAAFDQGVAVIDVVEGTPAWDAGLRRSMLITHVNRTPVHTPSRFRDAVAGRFGPIELRLVSDEGNSTLTVAAGP